jgi:hypothetical protein
MISRTIQTLCALTALACSGAAPAPTGSDGGPPPRADASSPMMTSCADRLVGTFELHQVGGPACDASVASATLDCEGTRAGTSIALRCEGAPPLRVLSVVGMGSVCTVGGTFEANGSTFNWLVSRVGQTTQGFNFSYESNQQLCSFSGSATP